MSSSLHAKSYSSKRMILAFALWAGVGINATGMAQAAPQAAPQARSPANPSDQTSSTSSAPSSEHRLIRPGDRNCLRDTGSLIVPKKGHCLPVAGTSYSREELLNTGAIDNAHALQMLDPSISIGH